MSSAARAKIGIGQTGELAGERLAGVAGRRYCILARANSLPDPLRELDVASDLAQRLDDRQILGARGGAPALRQFGADRGDRASQPDDLVFDLARRQFAARRLKRRWKEGESRPHRLAFARGNAAQSRGGSRIVSRAWGDGGRRLACWRLRARRRFVQLLHLDKIRKRLDCFRGVRSDRAQHDFVGLFHAEQHQLHGALGVRASAGADDLHVG